MKNPLEMLSRVYRNNNPKNEAIYIFQDVCGPVYTWPSFVKKIIISKTLNYRERVKLTTFFYVNGLREPMDWMEFIVTIKGSRFHSYKREIFDLFMYYNLESVQRKYFSYCMSHAMYEFLDGTPRLKKTPPKK